MSRETVGNAIGWYDADAATDLLLYGRVWFDGDGKRINPKDIYLEPDLTKCPKCKGPADNGHDRCLLPNQYYCTKCSAEPDEEWKSQESTDKAPACVGGDGLNPSAAVTAAPDFASADAGKGATSGNGGCPNIAELQRKADMADELAEALEKVSTMIPQDLKDERFGRVSNPSYYTLKDALAKYRGQS